MNSNSILTGRKLIRIQGKRCTRETSELFKLVNGEAGRLSALLRAQEALVTVIDGACEAFYKTYNEKENILKRLVREVAALKKTGFQNRDWPDNVDPLPLVRMTLSGMFTAQSDPVRALNYALRGCFVFRYYKGSAWISDLLVVCQVLENVCLAPPDSAIFEAASFPSRPQLRITFAGYLIVLCLSARFTFGADARLARAIVKWTGVYKDVPDQPPLGHDEFAKRFIEGQRKLLDWAAMKDATGVALPAQVDIEALVSAYEELRLERPS
jgi:hypothetical protein